MNDLEKYEQLLKEKQALLNQHNHRVISDHRALIVRLSTENDHLRDLLNNLLATIHGDGGHYVSEHGLDKAVEDAIRKVVSQRGR